MYELLRDFLRDEVWQGIGAIAGIISIIISLWQARQSRPRNKQGTSTKKYIVRQRIILAFFSILIPTYAIFVGSILLVNIFTRNSDQITYGSVALASLLGLLWGVIWANYIQKVFNNTSN